MRKQSLIVRVLGTGGTCLLAVCCESQTRISMGEAAQSFSVGDVNADGNLDLVVASAGEPSDGARGLEPEQLLVRLGRGNGKFGDVLRSPGAPAPRHTLLVDLDGDRRPDSVITSSGGAIQTLFGAGNGLFNARQTMPVCERALRAVSGRFDADAHADLAVLCNEEGGLYMTVLSGSATGALALGRTYDLRPSSFVPSDAWVADLNADTFDDIAVTGLLDGRPATVIHLNDGAGAFHALSPVPSGGARVAFADLDGDRKLDLVLSGASLVTLHGNGDGTFASAQTIASPEALGDIALGDFNADERVDIATTTASGLSLFLSQPNGGYARQTLSAGTNAVDVFAADFDRNGKLDLANLNRKSPSTITLFLNPNAK